MTEFDDDPFKGDKVCEDCGFDEVTILFTLGGDSTGRCLQCHEEARWLAGRNEDAEFDEWVLGIED